MIVAASVIAVELQQRAQIDVAHAIAVRQEERVRQAGSATNHALTGVGIGTGVDHVNVPVRCRLRRTRFDLRDEMTSSQH